MSITLEELEKRHKEIFQKRADYEAAKAEASRIYTELKSMQEEFAEILEAHGRTKYQSENGTFSFKYEQNWSLSANPEEKQAFFEYLKEKGLYDSMITVNSRTLNSFCKHEEEAALEHNDVDISIPGLNKSDPFIKVSMRKK